MRARRTGSALDYFAAGRQTEWRNRLIWGDKKYVLPSLLPEFAGKVNRIYTQYMRSLREECVHQDLLMRTKLVLA